MMQLIMQMHAQRVVKAHAMAVLDKQEENETTYPELRKGDVIVRVKLSGIRGMDKRAFNREGGIRQWRSR
jgi:hypothetical protein